VNKLNKKSEISERERERGETEREFSMQLSQKRFTKIQGYTI